MPWFSYIMLVTPSKRKPSKWNSSCQYFRLLSR